MTKEVFLNSLREKLSGLPKEDLDERINFYDEMIEDRMDEGLTEEEAVAEIGSVDDVVYEIAQDTPLVKIVKERIKPKRKLEGWEIALLVLGFPVWFPLVLTGFILLVVAYVLIWVFVIVSYSVELSFIGGSLGSLVAFFAYLANGEFQGAALGAFIGLAGAALLFFFACRGITIGTVKLHQAIFTSIKAKIIKKGGDNK